MLGILILFQRYFAAKTKVGRNWYQLTGIALVLGRWTFFLNFKETPSWILQKNFLPPLKPKLFGNVRKNCEIVQKVCKVLYTV